MSGSGLPTGTTSRRNFASFGAVRGSTIRRTCGPRTAAGAFLATVSSASGFVVLGKCSLDSFPLFPFSGEAARIFFRPILFQNPGPASLSLPQGRGALLCSTPRYEPPRPERDPEVENAHPKRP